MANSRPDSVSTLGAPGWLASQLAHSLTPAATYRQLSPARGANAREQLDTSDRGWISEWFARCRLEILVALRDGADPAGVPGAPAHAIALYWERIARAR